MGSRNHCFAQLTIRAWFATSFAVLAAAIAFAVDDRVATKVNGEGILLIENETLSLVRATGTGRLVALSVKRGDWVEPGQAIALISQVDLENTIHEAESKLNVLRREDQELTQSEEREREAKEAARRRVRETILRARNDDLDKLKIAERGVNGANRLRAERLIGNAELLESRKKLYDVRDALNKGESRLAELELERVTSENAVKRASQERRLKIGELETKLKLDLARLRRTSRVVSDQRGRVNEFPAAQGDVVREGAPIVLLQAPRRENGERFRAAVRLNHLRAGGRTHANQHGRPGRGRPGDGQARGARIHPGKNRRHFGGAGNEADHGGGPWAPCAGRCFSEAVRPGVLLRVLVKLEEKSPGPVNTRGAPPSRENPFRWSSASGSFQPLKTGTLCEAAIVVERRPLITLIAPWTRKLLPAD